MAGGEGYLRIGELARRTGLTPEVLRAWERRYSLLHPSRSTGGYRLYSDADERRVRRTKQLIDSGWSVSQAAREAAAPDPATVPGDGAAPPLDAFANDLRGALADLDGRRANEVFDELLAGFSVRAVLRDIVIPYLHDLGDRWERGDASVAQEHFASNLIRGRLMGLARDWGSGAGPSVVLACLPGEEHEFALIMLGIVLARGGWQVTFLGADTPFPSVEEATGATAAVLVVLSATTEERILAHEEAIRSLAAGVPVAMGGAITREKAQELGVRFLGGDPIAAADALIGPARVQGARR